MIKVDETQIKARLKERLIKNTNSIEFYDNCEKMGLHPQWIKRFIFYINPEGVIFLLNRIFIFVQGKPASSHTVQRVKKVLNSPFFLKFVPFYLIIRIKSYFIGQ